MKALASTRQDSSIADAGARHRSAGHRPRARIGRLLTGAYYVSDKTLRIDARIVDARTGVNEASDSVEGQLDEFFDLQKRLVLSMLRRLRVQLSPEEGQSIEKQNHTDVDAYRLLLESEGIVEPSPRAERTRRKPAARRSSRARPLRGPAGRARRGGFAGNRSAGARCSSAIAARWRAKRTRSPAPMTFSTASARRCAPTSTPPTISPSRSRHHHHAGGGYLVSLRRDQFTDASGGRPVRLEVRLTKVLVREQSSWKIGADNSRRILPEPAPPAARRAQLRPAAGRMPARRACVLTSCAARSRAAADAARTGDSQPLRRLAEHHDPSGQRRQRAGPASSSASPTSRPRSPPPGRRCLPSPAAPSATPGTRRRPSCASSRASAPASASAQTSARALQLRSLLPARRLQHPRGDSLGQHRLGPAGLQQGYLRPPATTMFSDDSSRHLNMSFTFDMFYWRRLRPDRHDRRQPALAINHAHIATGNATAMTLDPKGNGGVHQRCQSS